MALNNIPTLLHMDFKLKILWHSYYFCNSESFLDIIYEMSYNIQWFSGNTSRALFGEMQKGIFADI